MKLETPSTTKKWGGGGGGVIQFFTVILQPSQMTVRFTLLISSLYYFGSIYFTSPFEIEYNLFFFLRTENSPEVKKHSYKQLKVESKSASVIYDKMFIW